MKYFSIEELCYSNTAQVKGINNTPTQQVKDSLTALVNNVLDPIREKYDKPITINCGYRSPSLNKAVGGVPTSQHLKGEAVDIANNINLQGLILRMAKTKEIVFDQLIIEKPINGIGVWLHISYKAGKNRNQILVFKNGKYEVYKG